MDYDSRFNEALDGLRTEGRYRVFMDILRLRGAFPHALLRQADGGERRITVWCSNDYLGMGQNPAVLQAISDTVMRHGAGAGGTRNISGTSHPIVQLEKELADWHGKKAALVFTSGFISNEATLSTLARLLPGCQVYSDELNHASMIQGIRHSGAKKFIFKHNDAADL